MILGVFFLAAGFLRCLAAFAALSAGLAASFLRPVLRPLGTTEGAPAFLRPAARRGC